MKNIHNKIDELSELTTLWLDAKKSEQDANRERLSVEARILELVTLKDKGTNNLETGLKIVTGYTEKWDQEFISDAASNWTSELPFPFKTEFKPVKALLDVIESADAGKYRALQKALTLTPSKPSFSFKGE